VATTAAITCPRNRSVSNNMAFFDNNQEGFQKWLAGAFGLHVVQGHLVMSREEFSGVSGDKEVWMRLAVGDGASRDEFGEGAWEGPIAVFDKGRKLDVVDWRFFPGTLSTGYADPVQGESPFFPGSGTNSGTAVVDIHLAAGLASEPDPTGIDIIMQCAKIGDYDVDGNRTEISYSPNPARVKAYACKRAGKLSRIDWPYFVAARNYYDVALDWAAGGVSEGFTAYTGVPTYKVSGSITADAGTGAITKQAGSTYMDNSARTAELIRSGTDGYFRATIGGSFPTGVSYGGGMFLLDRASNQGLFGIAWGNDHFGILANGVFIDDSLLPYDFPLSPGDVVELGTDDDAFYLKVNGVIKTIPHGIALVPADTDLIGQIQLAETDDAVTASSISGDRVSSTETTTTAVKRFEAHPAFTAPTDLQSFLDFVDSLCASETVNAGGKIRFLTPAARVAIDPPFDDRINVEAKSVKFWESTERPTQLWATYRDTLDPYLQEKPASDVREQLFDDLGRHTRIGPLNFASMSGSQSQRLIKYEMRKRSDDKLFCELVGGPSHYHLLPGDVKTVLSRKRDYVPLDMVIIKVSREGGTAGKRKFTLREYHPDDYRDSDHQATQQTAGITPTATPPGNPVLTLEQQPIATGGIAKIHGTIFFPVAGGSGQLAKVFVTKPGGVEEFTGLTLSPVAGIAVFDYIAEIEGEYTFRVTLESTSGVPGGEASASIMITFLTPLVDSVSGAILIDSPSGEVLYDSGGA
jgi:hypothetical protein